MLVTEWPEFARFDLDARPMRTPIVLDGRNFLDPEAARRAGFVYLGVGRQTEAPPYAPALLHELVPLIAANDGAAHTEPPSPVLPLGGTRARRGVTTSARGTT